MCPAPYTQPCKTHRSEPIISHDAPAHLWGGARFIFIPSDPIFMDAMCNGYVSSLPPLQFLVSGAGSAGMSNAVKQDAIKPIPTSQQQHPFKKQSKRQLKREIKWSRKQ